MDFVSLLPQRIDLIVKYRLFKAWLTGHDVYVAEDVYRRHILERTKGQEPVSPYGDHVAKSSVDDYLSAARALLKSMQQNGFDPDFPIPVGNNELLLNGAHRLACAEALGLDVIYEPYDRPGHWWGWKWFLRHNFSRADQLWLLLSAADLLKDRYGVCLLHPSAVRKWRKIVEYMGEVLPVIGYIDLSEADITNAVSGQAGGRAEINGTRLACVLLPEDYSSGRIDGLTRAVTAEFGFALHPAMQIFARNSEVADLLNRYIRIPGAALAQV